jgi:hypothetical protein
MFFDPLGALARVIVGVYATKKTAAEADAWLRFGASLFGTAFVSLTGAWGMSIWALYPKLGVLAALVLGFADGLIAMAATTFLLWSRSPLTKGIPLMVPSQLAEKALQEDTTYTERK